jgi:hypothetical protein
VKGHPESLRALLVAGGFIDPAGFDAHAARAEDLGVSIEEMLDRESGLDGGRLDALLRESVEAAVLDMFAWESGDFSFDVRSERQPEDPKLQLGTGINAQYLAMEGMRRRDEGVRREGAVAAADKVVAAADKAVAAPDKDAALATLFGDEELEADEAPSGAAAFTEGSEIPTIELLDDDRLAAVELDVGGVEEVFEQAAANLIAGSAIERVESESLDETDRGEGAEAPPVESTPDTAPIRPGVVAPIVVIEPDAAMLEWLKSALQSEVARVHVFQQAEQGLSRIRQYLVRGELPVVLISPDVKVDPLSGIRGLGDFVKRLKGQAPRLPVFWLAEETAGAPAGSVPVDGCLPRPAAAALRDEALSATRARSLADDLDRALAGGDGA